MPGISPMYTTGTVGQTGPALSGTVLDDNNEPVNLTGAVFNLIIHNTQTLVDKNGAGTFQPLIPENGTFQYLWAAGDTLNPAVDLIILEYTLNGFVFYSDPVSLTVQLI